MRQEQCEKKIKHFSYFIMINYGIGLNLRNQYKSRQRFIGIYVEI